jgi:hypothetical protein
MLSDKRKNRIESLPTEEMLFEINRGHKSRFQNESFVHLKTCYDLRKRDDEEARLSRREAREEESLDIASRALAAAESANSIACEARDIARHERKISIIAAIAAIVAAIAAIIAAMKAV